MAELAIAATVASTLLTTLGHVQSGRAAAQAAKAEQQALELRAKAQEREAQALEQEAGQERARAQRRAFDARREGNLIRSRARALGAASGALLDPNILGDIDFEADRRVFEELAEGEEAGRGLEFRAGLARAGAAGDVYAGDVARRAGKTRRQQSNLAAFGTLLEGGSSIYDKYQTFYPG